MGMRELSKLKEELFNVDPTAAPDSILANVVGALARAGFPAPRSLPDAAALASAAPHTLFVWLEHSNADALVFAVPSAVIRDVLGTALSTLDGRTLGSPGDGNVAQWAAMVRVACAIGMEGTAQATWEHLVEGFADDFEDTSALPSQAECDELHNDWLPYFAGTTSSPQNVDLLAQRFDRVAVFAHAV